MQIIIVEDKVKCSEQECSDRKNICFQCEYRAGEICSQSECLIDRKIVYIESVCPIGEW